MSSTGPDGALRAVATTVRQVAKPAWLGYERMGGRFEISHDETIQGVSILGHGARDLASLVAHGCDEAGRRVLVLDIDGSASREISGYINSYDVSYFLYDVCGISGKAGTQAQLAASAYTSALNLSFDQEAIINAAMQKIAMERGIASPSGVIGFLGSTEGFRGASVDQLRGRLAYLRSLDMIGEIDVVAQMLSASCIANFASLELPEAAELAAALLLAKVVSSPGAEDDGPKWGQEAPDGDVGPASSVPAPEVIVVPQTHRIFPHHSVINHSARLLNTLLSSKVGKVFASDLPASLSRPLVDSCHTRIVSSAVWNEKTDGMMLTPNMFMVEHSAYGHVEPFIPRECEPKARPPRRSRVDVTEDRDLVKMILDAVGTNRATRQSIVGWLSVEYPRQRVEVAVDRLKAQGHITSALVESGGRDPIPGLALTDSGRRMLEEVS